jgi:hypothetical protein
MYLGWGYAVTCHFMESLAWRVRGEPTNKKAGCILRSANPVAQSRLYVGRRRHVDCEHR